MRLSLAVADLVGVTVAPNAVGGLALG